MVWIYTYCPYDDTDNNVSKHLDTMVKERGKSLDADNLRINLIGLHYNMRYLVKDKGTNVQSPLIQIPAPKKTTTGLLFSWTHGIS